MTTTNIQFTAMFDCELYLEPRETIEEGLVRGSFQHFSPELLMYRTFELDDDGEPYNFGAWQKSISPASIDKLGE